MQRFKFCGNLSMLVCSVQIFADLFLQMSAQSCCFDPNLLILESMNSAHFSPSLTKNNVYFPKPEFARQRTEAPAAPFKRSKKVHQVKLLHRNGHVKNCFKRHIGAIGNYRKYLR